MEESVSNTVNLWFRFSPESADSNFTESEVLKFLIENATDLSNGYRKESGKTTWLRPEIIKSDELIENNDKMKDTIQVYNVGKYWLLCTKEDIFDSESLLYNNVYKKSFREMVEYLINFLQNQHKHYKIIDICEDGERRNILEYYLSLLKKFENTDSIHAMNKMNDLKITIGKYLNQCYIKNYQVKKVINLFISFIEEVSSKQ